jgi:hypothetical protein
VRAYTRTGESRGRMYRFWYWAMIDRETNGRFVASIPDLGDLAAYGDTDKDAVAHVTELARESVQATWRVGSRSLGNAITTRCQASFDLRRSAALLSQLKWSAAPRGLRHPMRYPPEPAT